VTPLPSHDGTTVSSGMEARGFLARAMDARARARDGASASDA
jgi:hypothetical protein